MNSVVVPNFILAKTPQLLRVEMQRKQISLQRKLHFFDISFNNGQWIAWYEITTQAEAVIRG